MKLTIMLSTLTTIILGSLIFFTSLEASIDNSRTRFLPGGADYNNNYIYDSGKKIERDLVRARTAIRKAIRTRSYESYGKNETFIPRGSIYRNPYAFHQSHIEMVRSFKIWVYKEGQPPLFHIGPVNNLYSIEGQFIDEMESGRSHFLAHRPEDATTFFIPVSIVKIIFNIYRPLTTYSRASLQKVVSDYITVVANKYPFWNRSMGADHFFVSCHDWAPHVSAGNPELFKNFIRVLCNANSSEGFKFTRDVSLPETFIPFGSLGPQHTSIDTPSNRTIFAFFAGGEHGDVREQLFKYWKDKDKEIQVHSYLPKNINYYESLGNTKFCLCPSGYEVASPRIVESIHAGCVPVIISEGYVLPFSDTLDWTKFSFHLPVSKIRRLKKMLKGISKKEYEEKRKAVLQVQRHFVVNRPSKPFDLIHMVLHSIWLRRLNIGLPL